MKNPNIIFFRRLYYSDVDEFFEKNADKLICTVTITHDKEKLNELFNSNNHLLVTYGESESEYINDVNSVIAERMRKRWLHIKFLDNVDYFNNMVNYCYISNVVLDHEKTRTIFSAFTTCYNSYEKIYRAYNSLKSQTMLDWEWVILDDSPNDKHFQFLKLNLANDKRIRLYKRNENSGNIGNVKNEAVSLCRGKYVLELDHDDEILPDVFLDAKKVFDENEEVGFIYMDFINIYENGKNFRYSDFFALGYGSYYRQKYNDKWVFVCSTPNINNITLSHIVSVPNHPRIWRKDTLMSIGNYSEFLPVSDDYELLLRTAVNTKMVKIHKMGYVQYMNNDNNNFSLIRNAEINRLREHLTDHCYNTYKIQEKMKQFNGYENENFISNHSQIWKRQNYIHNHCNKIINLNYKKQYCIIGIETLYKNLDEINQLYKNTSNDFLLLDNKFSSDSDTLCVELDRLDLTRMRCYSMIDCSDEELARYFMLTYKSCDKFYIYHR